jgi:hypothetical protein
MSPPRLNNILLQQNRARESVLRLSFAFLYVLSENAARIPKENAGSEDEYG